MLNYATDCHEMFRVLLCISALLPISLNCNLQFIYSLRFSKSEKRGIIDKYIDLARILTGLKHSQITTAYII